MSEKNEISEAGKEFAAKLQSLNDAINEAMDAHKKDVADEAYHLLTQEYPSYPFVRERVHLGSRYERYTPGYTWSNSIAYYQDSIMVHFSVDCYGEAKRETTPFSHALPEALYIAENAHTVCIVKKRDDRECEVEAYHKMTGSLDTSKGWSFTRLVHEDSYGSEYITIDGEKCYLESGFSRYMEELNNVK